MEVIHKIQITAEARFDIVEGIGLKEFDWRLFKSEVEEYITYLDKAGRIPWWGYFRADYLDEDSGKRLKLFFYKGRKDSIMQIWELWGICENHEWSEEFEEDGHIREWLNTRVPQVSEKLTPEWLAKRDWAIRARVHEIIQNTNKTLWVNVLREVTDAFDDKRDKEAAEKVALLQSVYFEKRGRTSKKDKRNRKGGCRFR